MIKKTSKGKKTAAILPIKKYEELMEDLHDLAVVAERRDETTITSNKLKERLRKNQQRKIYWVSIINKSHE